MRKQFSLAGAHTALVTPFSQGTLDETTLIKLIERQIAAGINGLVPTGTTGESPTLTHEEQLRVIELTIKTTAGRALVIAGTGFNSTSKTRETTQEAERLGADAVMLMLPYYNKPSPQGVYEHFRTVAHAVNIPIVIYDAPGRCGISLTLPIAERLASDCPNIIAIKDCNASTEHIAKLRESLPPHFQILSGDDMWTLPFLKVGALGVISVAANFIPKVIVELVSLFQSGLLEEAEELHCCLSSFFRDLFIETNPVPIKTVMAFRGLLEEEFRLPLLSLSKEHRATLLATLQKLEEILHHR